MKTIFQDYDISTQFTPVNTLKSSLVHPKDKQQQSRQSNVVYEICCNPNFACQDAYIGETSQPLQHRLKQHSRSSYSGNYSAVFEHIIASRHQINVNVANLDKEENWIERGVKEAAWIKTKHPPLNCYGGTRITLSHSWDRSVNTTLLFSISDKFRK